MYPPCRLLDVVGNNTPLQDAFLLADDVLRQVCMWVGKLRLKPVTTSEGLHAGLLLLALVAVPAGCKSRVTSCLLHLWQLC